MKLRTKDRLILRGMLQQASDGYVTMKLVREAIPLLDLTPEEMTRLNFRQSDQGFVWNVAADDEVDIKFETEVFSLILKRFEKLDKEQQMTLDHLATYEKFLAVIQNA